MNATIKDQDALIVFNPQNMQMITASGKRWRLVAIRSREFDENTRTTKDIFAEAIRRGWRKPPEQIAELFKEKFSRAGVGVVAVTSYGNYNGPINLADAEPLVFGICRMSDKSGYLGVWCANPEFKWVDDDPVHDVDWIFVFIVSAASENITIKQPLDSAPAQITCAGDFL
jgi:hypothetical protein